MVIGQSPPVSVVPNITLGSVGNLDRAGRQRVESLLSCTCAGTACFSRFVSLYVENEHRVVNRIKRNGLATKTGRFDNV